jgi:hypothetical protein
VGSDVLVDEGIHHCGIVVKVDGLWISTIEGNKGNTVGTGTYRLGQSPIVLFGRPAALAA